MAFVLIGFMGAGKSTLARELGAALAVDPIDSDELLAKRLGRSVAEEFSERGEESFRASEEELVGELLAGAGPRDVVALGGGSVLASSVQEALRRHVTILLDVAAEDAWERTRSSGEEERPLARDRARFAELHASRRPLYERLADAILPSPPPAAAPRLLASLEALADAPSGTKLLWASSDSGAYPVLVGRGLLSDVARVEGLWPLDRSSSRAFCVTDENVAPLYAERLGRLAGVVSIAPGEDHKTLAGAERVWEELAAAGMTRADHLVALGGGVVGDLAGFCAATYQRGVKIVHVPTTLVAQVDSAYGGKTGIDLPRAKNYVGAYHQPAGVLVDTETLSSLPAAELSAGWVEVVKTALIAGGPLWERVSAGGGPDDQTILECVRTKLAVVAADERDAGVRQTLNLGHTVGHAIEAASGYARYRHGEAVGLGLLAALRLSGREDLRMRVAELLAARSLPLTLADVPVEDVLRALQLDKKRVGETVPFVLVEEPGRVTAGHVLDGGAVHAAVEELIR